jgi:hypothetical protein
MKPEQPVAAECTGATRWSNLQILAKANTSKEITMSVHSVRNNQPSKFNRNSFLHVLAVLLFSAALAATASAQNTVTFFDATFGPAWVGSVAGITGTVTYTFTPVATGGYPGAYEKESHTLTGSGGFGFLYLANFNPVNTFTGSFKSLSYSYDLQNPGAFDVAYFIAVQQTVNGVTNVYVPNKTLIGPTGFDVIQHPLTWANAPNPFFQQGLTASDFCRIPINANYGNDIDCTSNPDFSNPAQPTEFGYVVGNSFSGRGPVRYQTGMDNWCVVLDGASGPGGVGRGCKGVY